MKIITFTICLVLNVITITKAQWLANGSNIYNSNANNVGIGTASPVSGKLEVRGFQDVPIGYFRQDRNNGGSSNAFFFRDDRGYDGPNNGTTFKVESWRGGFQTIGGTLVNFSTINDGIEVSRFLVDNLTGNIGINKPTPTEKLDIGGSVRIPLANANDNDSPGILAVSNDDFPYDVEFLNHYGLGFHTYSDPSSGGVNGINLYASAYYGLDFFTAGINRIRVNHNGNVGIGTVNPDFKLTVNGKIKAEEIQVVVDVPADYVFTPTYKLMPLSEVSKHIQEKGHLPNVPSAEQLKANGWNVGEMNNKLLEKIEELTLYMIEFKKENDELRSRLEKIEKKSNADQD